MGANDIFCRLALAVRRRQRLQQNRDAEVAPTLQQQAGRRGKNEKRGEGPA